MTIIQKIKLYGFKSFAKPIEFQFGNNFNVVLGPNGSGKSNLMDALCFVLGKISAKSMRAEKSSHLIFNGGKKGSPMKEARVDIYFDNSKKEFPSDDQTIKVSRIVRTNGNSIYKINNETKNRQEVIDLLTTARIDPDGHNIILQGDIIRFADMHPEERREIIEEIAGISVYEDKKHKAMLELEKVDQKLNDASLILKERSSYLRELKKDRDKAQHYKELETDIRSNKATFLYMQMNDRNSKKEEIDSRLNKNNSILDKINSKIAEIKQEITDKKQKINSLNTDIEEKGEKEQITIQKEIENLRTSTARNTERSIFLSNEIKKIQARKEQLKKNLEDTNSTISNLEKTKNELQEKFKLLQQEEIKNDGKLKKFKSEHGIISSTSDIDNLEIALDEKQNKILALQEKKNSILQQTYELTSKINHFKERLEEISSLEKDIDVKKFKEKLKKAESSLNLTIEEDNLLNSKLNQTRRTIFQQSQELEKLKLKQFGINESLLGDVATKSILNLNKKGVHGLVSELGKVNKKYSLALEIAAGPRMKSIIVEDDKIAADCIAYLKKNKLGIATFLPINKIKPRPQTDIEAAGAHGSALNLIKYDKKFENIFSYIFAQTLVVDDVDAARRIGIGKARMVTLDGDLLETSGVMIGGYRRRHPSLSFKEEDSEKEIQKLESEISKLKELVDSLDKRKLENESKLKILRDDKISIESELMRFEKTIGALDTSDIEKEKLKLEEQLAPINSSLKEIEKTIIQENKEFEKLKQNKLNIRSSLKDLRNPEIASSLNKIEERKQKIREEIIQTNSELKNIDIQVNNIYLPEKENTFKIIKQHEKETEEFQAEVKSLNEKLNKDNSALNEKEKKEVGFRQNYKALFLQRNKFLEELQKRENLISLEEMKIKDIQEKINSISIQRAKIIAEFDAFASEFEGYKGEKIRRNISVDDLKLEIQRFERMKNDLGSVNMKALEIYENVNKEYTELIDKIEKLKLEKEDILKIMDEVESKKSILFMQTFNAVAASFKDIFLKLSVKGEAFLELENKEKPLSAGINIKVRVIGNKFLDLKSLSGGEKTLTALAMIFAIQELQPASFYLLDEVDAALDKRNSALLSRLIKKYSTKAQYILISHNDSLISEADQIYGVSMQENGISKVISLKL